MKKGISKRNNDYSAWYNEIIKKAELAENSPVKGSMIIRPNGYAIWEIMQAVLDKKFKETGHSNAYFPIFIPKSYFSKEANHVDGFAKECAIVTHYRLKNNPNEDGLIIDPEAKLEEELIVRPTSETIIWDSYKRWIQSYRDLPILLNQWANVVRWEMRTRLFLRTSEFLWQEGHTAHETKGEAEKEAIQMINVYADFVENYMALPVLKGIKTESERFAGADNTYCIETLMQDGKALQAGTSHFLGQNFSKAFDVKFTNKTGKIDYVWGTSWGVSTRLMGALIMAHSDDEGLVLPPKLAPTQVVIIPIFKNKEELNEISKTVNIIIEELHTKNITVLFDSNDTNKPGWKFAEYEQKGIPIRVTIGPRDLKNKQVEVARRDTKEKTLYPIKKLSSSIVDILARMQQDMFKKALQFRANKTTSVTNYTEFKKVLKNEGGFIYAHWDGSKETEKKIKDETKATIRLIPINNNKEEGKCIITGKPSKIKVVFAKSY